MFIERKGQILTTLDNMSSMLGDYIDRAGVTMLAGGGNVSYWNLYRSQPWVYVCVNLISRRLASMPLKSYKRDGDLRDQLRPEDSELAKLLESPWDGGSTFDLVETILQQSLIYGRELVWQDRPSMGAPPSSLVPLDMRQVRRVREKGTGRLIAYEWRETPTSEPKLLRKEDIVDFSFAGAVSPLEPLAVTLQIEDAAQRSTKAFYQNGARPGGIFTTDSVMDPKDVQRIEDMLASDHAGVDNSFRVAVLGNIPNAKWNAFDMSADDAQTIEFRKLAREEVLACFTVPQPIGGVLDRATFSNIETQKDMWIVETIGTFATWFEQRLNAQLVRREPVYGSASFVEFDLSAALRGSPMQQAEAYQKLLNSGVKTPNELRRLENDPPIEDAWADAIYVPTNLTPVGSPGPLPSTPKQTQTQ